MPSLWIQICVCSDWLMKLRIISSYSLKWWWIFAEPWSSEVNTYHSSLTLRWIIVLVCTKQVDSQHQIFPFYEKWRRNSHTKSRTIPRDEQQMLSQVWVANQSTWKSLSTGLLYTCTISCHSPLDIVLDSKCKLSSFPRKKRSIWCWLSTGLARGFNQIWSRQLVWIE